MDAELGMTGSSPAPEAPLAGTPLAEPEPASLRWLIIRAVAGFAGYILRVFITTHLAVDFGFGLAVAAGCYLVAADGLVLRGLLAALLGLVLAVVTGFILSTQVTVSLSIARLVERTQIGRKSLDALLRVAGRNELLDKSVTVPRLGALLHDAARAVADEEVPRGKVSRLVGAISRRVLRVVLWLVARQVLASAQRMCEPDGTIRLVRVRDELSDVIDRQLVAAARTRTKQWSAALLIVCAAVALGAAWGIRIWVRGTAA
jgi:hypothetical protein